MNPNCRICLGALQEGETGFHVRCCRKMFESPEPPLLDFTQKQLDEMAERVVRRQISVPGVQPKLSLHLQGSGKGSASRLMIVGLAGGYILKPPVEMYPEMPELEHLTMRLARTFGIETADCALLTLEGGGNAYLSKRLDRKGESKLHMEDMCQLTDRLTEQKYRGSMEQIGRAVIRHSFNPLFDAIRLFDLTVFCFLTGNADMHFKNFSLLYGSDGEIKLSPAYDLLPTALLILEDKEEMALTINGRKRAS